MKLYIFVGMFDGINDRIEPYVNESDAERAWSEYTEVDYSAYENDNELLNYKYEGSMIYVTDFPMECYDPTRQVAIIWNIDDVKMDKPDLTDEQALGVLKKVHDKHDSTIGVSWTTLEEWAGILFPLPSGQSNDEQLVETAARLYKANSEVSADYSVYDALSEASEIHGIADLHNSEDDDRYGEYDELVSAVEQYLGLAN